MKTSYLLPIIAISGTILFVLAASDQSDTHKNQISKEDCMRGQYCPGVAPIPSASLGNRTVKVSLNLYSNPAMPNNIHYLWFRFFDANTNQTIRHVSFFLNITKNSDSLLHDMFHTHTGILILQVNSNGMPFNGTIHGDREVMFGGWMQRNDEPVVAYAPIFNYGNSTYNLNIQMLSIDGDNNTFNPGTYPQFDSQISTNNQNQSSTMSINVIPEFPIVQTMLVFSIVSVIAFHRVKFRK